MFRNENDSERWCGAHTKQHQVNVIKRLVFFGLLIVICSSTLKAEQLPSFPIGDFSWCLVGTAAGEGDLCVSVHAPMKAACERNPENNELVRDDAGQPVPAGCHPHVSGQFDAGECGSYSDDAIRGNAGGFAAEVLAVSQVAYPIYLSKLGQQCSAGDVKVHIFDQSPPDWIVKKILGFTPGLTEESKCLLAVTATPGPSMSAPWLSSSERVKGAVAHELFHCSQQFAGHSMNGPKWFVEGTALFAEDVVGDKYNPKFDSDHDSLSLFFNSSPTFLDREHDAGAPLIFLRENGDQFIGFDLVKNADPLSILVNSGSFKSQWHQASLATWNESPVPIWKPDNRAVGANSKPDGPGSLSNDQTVDLQFDDIAPLSYQVKALSIADDVGIVNLNPTVPDTTKASAVLQGGANESVKRLSNGNRVKICRRAVGECHKKTEQDLEGIELLGLVATNLSPTNSTNVTVTIDTQAPRLHGRWRTTALTTLGYAGTIQAGGMLSINEETSPDTFSEALHGASVYSELTGCTDTTTTGTVSGTVTTTYNSTHLNTAEGRLQVSPTAGSAAFQCIGASGNVILAGATAGLWIMGNEAGPWAPVRFILDDDTLRLTSKTHDGVGWNMMLSRVANEP